MVSIENYLTALHSFCIDCDEYFRNPDRFTASFDCDANEEAEKDFLSALNQGIYIAPDVAIKERFTKMLMIASLRFESLKGRVAIAADYSFGEDAIVSYRHGGNLFSVRSI